MCSKLKYTYFPAIFAACLAASCDSDMPDREAAAPGREVTFDIESESRASASTVIDRFAVFGDKKIPVDDDSAPLVIFDNTEVSYQGGKWTYDNVQYWYPKHEHSFVAVAPVSALATSGTPQYLNSQLSFTYTIPTSDDYRVAGPDDVADILAATHRRFFEDRDANTTTTFKFDHIMSKINLISSLQDNVMGDDEFIEFQEIELSGFSTQASFNILPVPRQSNTQTDDRVIEVNSQEKEGKMSIAFTQPVRVLNGGSEAPLFNDDAAIIMLPQAFAEDSEAKIILSYTMNNNPAIRHATIPLRNLKWEWGKSYSYKFTITHTGIKVEATTITEWDIASVGDLDAH